MTLNEENIDYIKYNKILIIHDDWYQFQQHNLVKKKNTNTRVK